MPASLAGVMRWNLWRDFLAYGCAGVVGALGPVAV